MRIIIKRLRKYVIRDFLILISAFILLLFLFYFSWGRFEVISYGILVAIVILALQSIGSGYLRIPSFNIVITENYVRLPNNFLEWDDINFISLTKIQGKRVIGISTKKYDFRSNSRRNLFGFDVLIGDQFEKSLDEISKILLKNFKKFARKI